MSLGADDDELGASAGGRSDDKIFEYYPDGSE